jgi:hypothetical protein
MSEAKDKGNTGHNESGLNLHHLQVALSEKTPPRRGPITAAIEYIAPRIPVQMGLNLGLAANTTIVKAPAPIHK